MVNGVKEERRLKKEREVEGRMKVRVRCGGLNNCLVVSRIGFMIAS